MDYERNNDIRSVHCDYFYIYCNLTTLKMSLRHYVPVLGTHINRLHTNLQCGLIVMLRNLPHEIY